MKEIVEKLKKVKAKKVLVQFPEGLKLKIQEIVKELEKEGFEIFLCLEPCFGACDVRDEEALRLGCNAILHIGHEKFIKKTKLPIVYWEYFIDADACSVIKKEIQKLKDFQKIGLVTSIQFVKLIPKAKRCLESFGKDVKVHKSLQYPGQVLGCSIEAAKTIENEIDCFLCISAGEFYAAGMVFYVKKPVFNLDLEKNEIYELKNFNRRVEKIIEWNKAQFKDSKKIGILISWKKGQIKGNYLELKKKLEKEGKEVYVLAMDEITPEKLEGLELDFLINFACPRLGIDDLSRFKIPMLNYNFIQKYLNS
ncbi:MAG: diphthamide biosynthesis enzyme Dph2 [Candidatus Aenigmatarchaeota archaeon]